MADRIAAESAEPRLRVIPIIELGLLALFAVLPLLIGDFLIIIATRMVILAMLAISFDLCWGYSGIMSFGQALFFGMAGLRRSTARQQGGLRPTVGRGPDRDAGRLGRGVPDRLVPAARQAHADHHLRGARHAHSLVRRRAAGRGLAMGRRRQRPFGLGLLSRSAATSWSPAWFSTISRSVSCSRSTWLPLPGPLAVRAGARGHAPERARGSPSSATRSRSSRCWCSRSPV